MYNYDPQAWMIYISQILLAHVITRAQNNDQSQTNIIMYDQMNSDLLYKTNFFKKAYDILSIFNE